MCRVNQDRLFWVTLHVETICGLLWALAVDQWELKANSILCALHTALHYTVPCLTGNVGDVTTDSDISTDGWRRGRRATEKVKKSILRWNLLLMQLVEEERELDTNCSIRSHWKLCIYFHPLFCDCSLRAIWYGWAGFCRIMRCLQSSGVRRLLCCGLSPTAS